MNIFSSYKVKIKHYNHIFEQTVEIYRNAVSFFIDVCDKEWNILEPLKNLERCREIEELTLQTKNNQNPKYDFNERFYKMPSYLRRSAINTATGCYSSYYSNLKNWEENPAGNRPKLQLDRNVMPTLYKWSFSVARFTNFLPTTVPLLCIIEQVALLLRPKSTEHIIWS